MDAQVEQLDDQRVRLTVEVPAHEVKHAVAHAVHDLGDRVKVPGFRAGKVPPQVLMSRLGKERLYGEAVDSHIGNWFWNAARGARIRPADRPDFSYELPTSDEESWAFTAEFPVQGPVEPADWQALEVPRCDVEVGDDFVEAGLEARQQTAAVRSAELTETLAMVQYRLGEVTYLDVVTAQTTDLQAQSAELAIETRRLTASVDLVRALGGGWSGAAIAPAAPRG